MAILSRQYQLCAQPNTSRSGLTHRKWNHAFLCSSFWDNPARHGAFSELFRTGRLGAEVFGICGRFHPGGPGPLANGSFRGRYSARSVCGIWILHHWPDRSIRGESFSQCRAVELVPRTCRCDLGKYPGASTCPRAYKPQPDCRSNVARRRNPQAAPIMPEDTEHPILVSLLRQARLRAFNLLIMTSRRPVQLGGEFRQRVGVIAVPWIPK